jgi:hypothetical protein
MKIVAITPTRGDRPEYLEQCKTLISKQVDEHIIVDYKPLTDSNDINDRIEYGLKQAAGADFIFVIEDDDYYPCDYINTLIDLWEQNGNPNLFGIAQSLYYHIGINKFKMLYHSGRASLFQTMFTNDFILPDGLKAKHFDVNIWERYNGTKKAILHDEYLAVGIKHGNGLCGGIGHLIDFYTNGETDKDKSILKILTNNNDFYLHP